MIFEWQPRSDDDSKVTTKNPLAFEPQTRETNMILELSLLSGDKSKIMTKDLEPEETGYASGSHPHQRQGKSHDHYGHR